MLSLPARWLWQQWYPGIRVHVAFLIPCSVCSVNEVLFSLKAQVTPVFWHMQAVQLPQVAKQRPSEPVVRGLIELFFYKLRHLDLFFLFGFAFYFCCSLKLIFCSIKTYMLWVSVNHPPFIRKLNRAALGICISSTKMWLSIESIRVACSPCHKEKKPTTHLLIVNLLFICVLC